MRVLGNIAIIAAGTVALAGMMLTNPDYQRATRPFVARVVAGEMGQTRLISGRLDSWQVSHRLSFTQYGAEIERETQGVFLIVGVTLSGTTASTMIDASWIGASGRKYATTRRIAGIVGQIEDLWLQPGLESRAIAIFELPPDEVEGGALRLSLRLDPDLDGVLLLAPPPGEPAQVEAARLGA